MDRTGHRRADHDPQGSTRRPSGRALVDDLLGRAVARTPLRFAPGQANSGAALEAVALADGTRLVVKRFSPADDLLMRLTHDAGRAASLWAGGTFDRLPPAIDHATLAAAPEGDGWVVVMRDVGEAILGDERTLAREESRRILAAAAAMHAAFAGERVAGLCSVLDWMTFMLPQVMEPWRGAPGGLPDWALRGWEIFFDVVPADVAGAVAAIHARPEALAAELERCEPTLVHGDLSPANVGLTPDRVVVLDWALPTSAGGSGRTRRRSSPTPGPRPASATTSGRCGWRSWPPSPTTARGWQARPLRNRPPRLRSDPASACQRGTGQQCCCPVRRMSWRGVRP